MEKIMKTIMSMKKIVCSMTLMALFSTSVAYSNGSAGGGGGAAIEDDQGRVQTFTSAGIKMNINQPLTDEDLKVGMDELKRVFLNQYISQEVKAKVVGAILPTVDRNLSDSRNYFSIQYSDLNDDIKKNVLQIYQQRLKVALKNPNEYENLKNRILQVGFTIGRNTYLLPKFFELRKASEQAAILFHESLWVINPNLSYDTVTAGESLMQRHIENHLTFDLELFGFLSALFNKKMSLVWAALKYDIENRGGIGGLISWRGKINFKSIFSEDTLDALTDPNRRPIAAGAVATDLQVKMQKYPRSNFFKALYYLRNSISLRLVISEEIGFTGYGSITGRLMCSQDYKYTHIGIKYLANVYFETKGLIPSNRVKFSGEIDTNNINLDEKQIDEEIYHETQYGTTCNPVKKLSYRFYVDKN